jgi:hypothetical protein
VSDSLDLVTKRRRADHKDLVAAAASGSEERQQRLHVAGTAERARHQDPHAGQLT